MLNLSVARPKPVVRRYQAGTKSFSLNQKLSDQIRESAKRHGVTLFMFLVSAFQALLYRHSGLDDICVGTPTAGRNTSLTRSLIGFFVNTLVLRTNLSENPTFQELLRRVRETCLEAFDHADVPFEAVVAELQPERNPSHHPLFQVWFVLQNQPGSTLGMTGVNLSEIDVRLPTTIFDLALSVHEGDQLNGSAIYDTDLFAEEAISELLGHFETFLAEAVNDPTKRILAIELDAKDVSTQLISMPEVDFAF